MKILVFTIMAVLHSDSWHYDSNKCAICQVVMDELLYTASLDKLANWEYSLALGDGSGWKGLRLIEIKGKGGEDELC